MTDTREKLRAVFLAAIMVLSVVAMTATFSGAAVAQPATNASVDFQNQDSLGSSVLVDEVNAEDYTGDEIIEVAIWNQTDDGDYDELLGTETVSISPTETEEDIFVDDFDVEMEESQTLVAGAYNASVNPDNPEDGLVAEDDAFVTLIEEYEEIDEGEDAPRIWVGQNIVIQGEYNLGEDYDVYAASAQDGSYFADDFVREVRAVSQGQLIIRTGTISPGVHVTENETVSISSGQQVNLGDTPSFELTEQTLNIDGVASSVVEGDDVTIGEIDSNRAGYELEATFVDEDGDAAGTFTVGDDLGDFEEGMTVSTEGVAPGDYTLEFNVVDTTATASAEVTVTEEPDRELSILSPTGQEDFVRGDIVPIVLETQGIDQATLTFGDRERGQSVEMNVTVEDTDGSGQATILLNTFQLGDNDSDNGVYAGAGTEIVDIDPHDDDLPIAGGSAGGDVIAAAGYDLVLSADNTAWKDSDALVYDRSVLRLQERGTEGVDIFTAPGTGDAEISPETTDEVEELIGEEVITPADGQISDNDYMLVRVESTGLEGVMQNATGDFEFLDRSEDHIVTDAWAASLPALVAGGIQADAGPNLEEFEIDMMSGLADENVIAGVDDQGNLDEFWLPIQIESGTDIVVGQDDRSLEPGEDMFAFFGVYPQINETYFVEGDNVNPPLANIEIETLGEAFEITYLEETLEPWTFVDDRASVTVEGTTLGSDDQLAVPQEENVTVSGQTNIAAGTPLTVNFVSATGADDAFFVSTNPTIEYVENAPNTWETTVDFHEYSVGTEFEVNIRRGGDAPLLNPRAESTPGVITDAPAVNEFVFDDQNSGGSTVMVQTFNTTQGGFIGIYDADGERLGSSDRLDIGEQNRIAISLDEDIEENQELTAVAYRTADREYVDEDGEPITQTAQITIEELDPAEFDVSDLSPQTAELDEPGAVIEVSATIENDGDEEGTQDVEVRIDGQAVDSQSVSLDGGESTTVTFEVDTSDLEFGTTYTHSVASEDDEASGTLTIADEPTPTPTPTPDEPTPTPTPDEPTPTPTPDADDDGAGFGVVVALLAFLGAALLAVRRQTHE